MGVMPFLATCHACKLLYHYVFLFLFEWRIKFSLSPTVPSECPQTLQNCWRKERLLQISPWCCDLWANCWRYRHAWSQVQLLTALRALLAAITSPASESTRARRADVHPRRQCRVCYARDSRTEIETTWICDACPSAPGLCVENRCFKHYHTKFDYSAKTTKLKLLSPECHGG